MGLTDEKTNWVPPTADFGSTGCGNVMWSDCLMANSDKNVKPLVTVAPRASSPKH